jgi:hypothetical protein
VDIFVLCSGGALRWVAGEAMLHRTLLFQ